ncbi:MAG: FixH family protein [Chloroflexia bacterium]
MKKILLFICLLALLPLAACSDSINATPTGVTGTLQLVFSTIPDPPTKKIETTIRIEVKDASGKPVEGARVELSSDMIGMSHGGPKGVLADKGGGIYEATGSFVMGGTWRAEVVATKDGGSRTVGIFDFEVE